MGKKPKKGGQSDDWENDVDEMEKPENEDIDDSATPTPPPAKTADTVDDIDAMWSDDDDKKKKKKGKKGKGKAEPEDSQTSETPTPPPPAGDGVKSKAQKAAEKKERQKQQKKDAAAKKKGKGGDAPTPEPEKDEPEPEAEEPAASSKKKGKKGAKEEEKKPKAKGPRAAALAKILEEQRLREEEQKRLDEVQRQKEEAALAAHKQKQEDEKRKREKKREREKARIQRRKDEGTFLSEKDKIAKARAEHFKEMHGLSDQTAKSAQKTKILTKAQKKKLQDEQRRLKEEQEAESLRQLEEQMRQADIAAQQAVEQPAAKADENKESDDAWDDSSSEEEEEIDSEENAEDLQDEENDQEDDEADEEAEESDEEDEPEESSESEPEPTGPPDDDFFHIEDVADRIEARRKFHKKNAVQGNFRCPVVCVLGHVDTGKTKILDNLRKTNVQDGEAGGITQQIGATNVPLDCIKSRTDFVETVAFGDGKINIPGLLIIDTPGHESFSNLRSRGSSLCDVAILVIDIMHGLENQTRESIKLLKKNKTPFVVALNKIDRLYQWQTSPLQDVITTLGSQKRGTTNQFQELFQQVYVQMANEELNVKLFSEFTSEDDKDWVPVVPTSAHSGDGMGNLMAQVIDLAQSITPKKITYNKDLKCTVMEVKAIEGLGKSIDAILVNGRLKNGDMIVLGGQQGPICTHIRQIYTPPSNKDLRTKNAWEKHNLVKGATGVKIVAQDIDKALAGLPLYVARRDDEVEYYKSELEREIQHALKSIKLHSEGVYVQASTLGSLEALLEFLRSEKVKYSAINIGPVNKRDIMKASTMLEHNDKYGVVLAFDVNVTRDAQELADSFKPPIKIFTADIIYHLTDQFTQHLKDQKKKKQDELKSVAIFPARVRILPNCIFAKRDPIIIGVQVEAGQLHVASPIYAITEKENLFIGTVSSIEVSGKPTEIGKVGEEVCIKIDNTTGDAPKLIGRHFEVTDLLVTKISREGLDALKEWFRDEMTKNDWELCRELKRTFKIL